MPREALISGESRRALDERFRLTLPGELADYFTRAEAALALVKEQPGCLSLWVAEDWRQRYAADVELIEKKLAAGRLRSQLAEVQQLGRLLSTRHGEVKLDDRGRMLVPESFREFLGVEPGGEVVVVGAAICVEIWRPTAWMKHLEENLPRFSQLLEELTG